MLRLQDRWLWDFWFARAGEDFHLFFLQAPREPAREELRHANASVGHAVSRNLTDWRLLPDALAAGAEGEWDDRAIWTGSVIEHDDGWSMLYTGTNRAEGGLVQRIGLATSSDLLRWDKHAANPVLEADPRWYELLDLNAWHDQAWRDPWLYRNPADGAVHAPITARASSGPADGRGVIGHARSLDCIDWEVLPPLTAPGEFGELEVPQLVAANDRIYLLFSSLARRWSRRRSARSAKPPMGGTFYFVGADPCGPFELPDNAALAADPDGSLYSGRLVADGSGSWQFLAFRNVGPDRTFVGELTDPSRVAFGADGSIRIDRGRPNRLPDPRQADLLTASRGEGASAVMEAKPKGWASEYAAWFDEPSAVERYHLRPPYPAETFDLLASLVGPPRVVLDAGCGPGDLARGLAPLVDRVDAVDRSAAMIARGRLLPDEKIRWIHAAIEDAALEPPYALIVAGDSIHWFDWQTAFRRFCDVLAPSGWLAVVYRDWLRDPQVRAQLGPIYARHGANPDFAALDPVQELERRGLFETAASRTTSPVPWTPTPEELIGCHHSQNGFLIERMRDPDRFDEEVLAAVEGLVPVRGGRFQLDVVATITWGHPQLANA